MNKFVLMALLGVISAKHTSNKFATGYARMELHGETIRMKDPGTNSLKAYSYLQTGAEDVRGEKQWQAWAGDMDDYGNDAVNFANKRLPYVSELQLDAEDPRGEKEW